MTQTDKEKIEEAIRLINELSIHKRTDSWCYMMVAKIKEVLEK